MVQHDILGYWATLLGECRIYLSTHLSGHVNGQSLLSFISTSCPILSEIITNHSFLLYKHPLSGGVFFKSIVKF